MQMRWQQHTWWDASIGHSCSSHYTVHHRCPFVQIRPIYRRKQELRTCNAPWKSVGRLSVVSVALNSAMLWTSVWAAGLQLPAGSRRAPLALIKCTQGCCIPAATSLTHFNAAFHWLFTSSFFTMQWFVFPSDGTIWLLRRRSQHLAIQLIDKAHEKTVSFPIINFFFVVVKTLQASNAGWQSMPTATRNISIWQKTDVYDFLLHFSCGMGTSQQAFNETLQHL